MTALTKGANITVDASALLLGAGGRARSDADLVFGPRPVVVIPSACTLW